ncbi:MULTISPECIES: hypothetical protein [Rubrivivax]|uniref:Uncharacterized protein n=1 Tax=Rubrivivax benzoatilyticus TaxID=316997 RepID=A0ABX0HWQ7_9BURK|nr:MULTISPECIES: hypothetical protein [Rubrivivax]MCD0420677.1 hypothetical protein [Rubrivivax sp. JA1024]EGJ10938.1 hypothetical protein RBXJA2T_11453 [Rubrivivax benzoatilyticus JA2 = ATCC BAA-35]MCC9595637.1 hypothetical protein [Rubrivivax sp. JA1055]MCC9646856.1 hypothetical protein [Rubrivivax sp. JA1029]NHK97785.1 hypothetical protein [Rubrivivax benzoatilyticus]
MTDPDRDSPVLVRLTRDGRRVEVIAGAVCLDGRPEAHELVPLSEHPNRSAVLALCPDASHMAGRLALTLAEASVAQAALRRARDGFDGSEAAVRERLRQAVWQRSIVGQGVDE